jgi:hypothetical protein
MRESQMKKIIAAAVATAFVAPAFAADVTLTGAMELSYYDAQTTTSTSKTMAEDGSFQISATTETDGGLTVTASMGIESDASRETTGNKGLIISGAHGTLTLGDTSGAVDQLDAALGHAYVIHGSGLGGRNDAAVAWKLPTLVDGLTVTATYTPENGGSDELDGTFVTSDTNGIALKYSINDLTLGYATETASTTDYTMMSVGYNVAGFGLKYENNEADASGTITDNSAWSLAYTMDKLTVVYSNESVESSGTKSVDNTGVAVHYDLGGGVVAFAEQEEDDKASGLPENFAVGVAMSF